MIQNTTTRYAGTIQRITASRLARSERPHETIAVFRSLVKGGPIPRRSRLTLTSWGRSEAVNITLKEY